MDFLISRTKGLFQYGDLSGDTRSTNEDSTLDVEGTGILSANNKVRRSRRRMWIGTVICGLVAIIIIVAAVKNRHHLKAAARALIDSVSNEHSEVETAAGLSSARQGRTKYSFNDFLRYSYYPLPFNGTWVSDTEILFRDRWGGISITNVATSETQTVVSHNLAVSLHLLDFTYSADRQYLLFKTGSTRVWRRSSFGTYSLVRLSGGRTSSQAIPILPPNARRSSDDDDLGQYIRLVTWAPEGNALAYVDYNNNIFYRNSAEAEDIQLTSSGREDIVFNGIPDWVNEEEVFEDHKAMYWSPDGSKLVYGVFNDTLVDVVKLPRYGNWNTKGKNGQGYPFLQYFRFDEFRYPKVSSTNPMVSLWIADVGPPGSSNPIKQQNLPPPLSLMNEEYHYTFVRWATNSTVAVNWMNRIQNTTAINLCDVTSDATCHEVFVFSQEVGWVDYKFDIVFNKYKPAKRFLTIMPANPSGSTGPTEYRFRQLFLIDPDTNSRTLMTSRQSEVTEILEWTAEDHVYYIGTEENQPGTRHLYRLELGQPESDCLTCHHKELMPHLLHRPKCEYVSVHMSKGGSYYVMECKGPGVPFTCLHHTATNTFLSLWVDNVNLENNFSIVDSSSVQYMEVAVPGSQQKAQVTVYLPSAVQTQPGKKFPMLVDVYGGPGSQFVDKQWNAHGYASYLSSSQGVIYVKIDPRGSGFQGDAWRHSVYRNFGSVEVTDTIHVTKYLQDNLDYVDKTRTAIWGWSYGGFLSLSALTKDTTDVFSCGASVAPVVRWELYDTYYTERYMSTLEDNPAGYNSSSPLLNIENMRNKKYLLVHGTHDDNVHYQQSMLLSAALEEKDILFRQQTYPDQDHSIADYRRHLYHTLTNFLLEECFHFNTDGSKKL